MVGGWAGCPFRQFLCRNLLSPPQPIHPTNLYSPCRRRLQGLRCRPSRPHLLRSRHVWRTPFPSACCPCLCHCPVPFPSAISPSPSANLASRPRLLFPSSHPSDGRASRNYSTCPFGHFDRCPLRWRRPSSPLPFWRISETSAVVFVSEGLHQFVG